MKEKSPLLHELLCFQMLDFENLKSNCESRNNLFAHILVGHYFFLVTSEGAISHNVLNY